MANTPSAILPKSVLVADRHKAPAIHVSPLAVEGVALKLKTFEGTGNTVRCNNQAVVDGGVGQGYPLTAATVVASNRLDAGSLEAFRGTPRRGPWIGVS